MYSTFGAESTGRRLAQSSLQNTYPGNRGAARVLIRSEYLRRSGYVGQNTSNPRPWRTFSAVCSARVRTLRANQFKPVSEQATAIFVTFSGCYVRESVTQLERVA